MNKIVTINIYTGWTRKIMCKIKKNIVRSMSKQECRTATQGAQTLTMSNLNPNIVKMEYAVRGPLLIRATEVENELKKGSKKSFNEVIKANIGDGQAMGQKPITFIRQLIALVTYPKLLDDPSFPEDVKKRAKIVLASCKGSSVGAYSDSPGVPIIREHAAKYIGHRDCHPAEPENVILSAGASEAIKNILKLLINNTDGKSSGIMVPIPQYPLYSATISEFNMHLIGYYLNESKNWGLDTQELCRAIGDARKNSNPRAIVVINPGNPTGQVLSRENIEQIIKFAYEEKLFILADEVYQHNIYAEGSEFHSFKKVVMEMGSPYNTMELASFMSCSKGFMSECGLRGGYVEVINMCPKVKAQYMKSISANLCPTVLGQTCLDAICNPPEKGEPSYDQFIKEKCDSLNSLKLRAKMASEAFNCMKGYSCNPVMGAMYAFPKITLPPKAIEAAKKQGKPADTFYAFQILEEAGICIVPGSGFGQQKGTYHFRTTILPQPEKLKDMLCKFEEFHNKFLEKYK